MDAGEDGSTSQSSLEVSAGPMCFSLLSGVALSLAAPWAPHPCCSSLLFLTGLSPPLPPDLLTSPLPFPSEGSLQSCVTRTLQKAVRIHRGRGLSRPPTRQRQVSHKDRPAWENSAGHRHGGLRAKRKGISHVCDWVCIREISRGGGGGCPSICALACIMLKAARQEKEDCRPAQQANWHESMSEYVNLDDASGMWQGREAHCQ